MHLNEDERSKYLSFECYHRPLSTVMNILIDAGFSITKVLELKDKDFNNPDKKFNFPPFLIIKSIKQNK